MHNQVPNRDRIGTSADWAEAVVQVSAASRSKNTRHPANSSSRDNQPILRCGCAVPKLVHSR